MGAAASLRRRLDWADTDAAGYWHHTTFWKYAEAGEAELLRSIDLDRGVFGHAPRRAVAAEFHRPVYFDEEVTIVCEVAAVGRTSATYRITVSVGDELAATGTMTVVLVGEDGRPAPWPETTRTRLAG